MINIKSVWNKGKRWVFIIGNILFLVLLIELAGPWGAIGYFAVLAAYSLFLIFRNWELVMSQIRLIEGILFGKPLDRDMWNPGEKPKLKRLRLWKKK